MLTVHENVIAQFDQGLVAQENVIRQFDQGLTGHERMFLMILI